MIRPPASCTADGAPPPPLGILTATDIARRVVAAGLSAAECTVGDVMTPKPQCVRSQDAAADALAAMYKGRFRHVPVLCADPARPAALRACR